MNGILDPDGKHPNPLTSKPYSSQYKALSAVWRKFPAYATAPDIIKTLHNSQVTLIISGTGSGKTVLVPKYMLHVLKYAGRTAVTLPKQIITQSAAEFAAETLDVVLGEQVGYQYRGASKFSTDTKLLYATDGTIVARLLSDPMLMEFDAVIIDEAHERKVQIDFLLYLLRETLKLRPEFKLVIMSATVNAKLFSGYFSKFKFSEVNIGGQTNYPIEIIWGIKQKYRKTLETVIDLVQKLLQKNDGDILVFVTSSKDAFQLCSKFKKVLCIEVYSGMPQERQIQAQTLGKRKLVIATNVAESSLTIDGIKYVVDTGYELKSSFDAELQARKLDRQLITQAQAKQRAGRSGRTAPGVCYRMYTQEQFDEMIEYPLPDIHTTDITDECLRLLNIAETTKKLNTMLNNFIEPPKQSTIDASLRILSKLGYIQDGKITSLGQISTQLADPVSSLAIIHAKLLDCSHEMIKIMSLIEASKINLANVLNYPRDYDPESVKQKFKSVVKKLAHPSGDHLSLLGLIIAYETAEDREQWCIDNFVNMKTLNVALKSTRSIEHTLRSLEITPDIVKIDPTVRQLPVEKRISHILNIILPSTKEKKLSQNTFLQTKPEEVIYSELFINNGERSYNLCSVYSK